MSDKEISKEALTQVTDWFNISGATYCASITSDIIADINRGCIANNLNEDCFSYRIIFFVNDGNNRSKHYIDTMYDNLRNSLENIIRNHLSVTNNLVIAETTVLKDGKSVCLQSMSYSFSLDGYFKQINGECKSRNRSRSYIRYASG